MILWPWCMTSHMRREAISRQSRMLRSKRRDGRPALGHGGVERTFRKSVNLPRAFWYFYCPTNLSIITATLMRCLPRLPTTAPHLLVLLAASRHQPPRARLGLQLPLLSTRMRAPSAPPPATFVSVQSQRRASALALMGSTSPEMTTTTEPWCSSSCMVQV